MAIPIRATAYEEHVLSNTP